MRQGIKNQKKTFKTFPFPVLGHHPFLVRYQRWSRDPVIKSLDVITLCDDVMEVLADDPGML